MLTLGIDDAGRGPVIGPMVLAGCLIDDETAKEFKSLGVKDSKQLTVKRRDMLFEEIKAKAETFESVIILPEQIDGNGDQRIKLNELEAIACADIINRINKGFSKIKVIVDCPSTNITKWTDFLKSKVNNLSNLEISCEHKADKNHISVSAASIIAKSIREKEMDDLKKKFGEEIGSGYTSDPQTKKFILTSGTKYKDSNIIRKTWATWKNSVAVQEQKKLGDFQNNTKIN